MPYGVICAIRLHYLYLLSQLLASFLIMLVKNPLYLLFHHSHLKGWTFVNLRHGLFIFPVFRIRSNLPLRIVLF